MSTSPLRHILIGALLGSLPLLLAQTGCWTTQRQGDALRRDVDMLKQRLLRDIEQSQKDRTRLQQVMEQATALLTRNSADLGAQVDRLQARVEQLGGQLEEVDKRINELNQQFTEFKGKVEVKLEGLTAAAVNQPTQPPVPQDKDELFQVASQRVSGGDQTEARRLLRLFIERFPNDSRVAKAQLLLGDSYAAEQKYAPAIVEYKKAIEQYRTSPLVPEGLYKIGFSFYQLKYCSDAQLFLRQLVSKYPKHAQVASANKVLKLITKYRRDRNVCAP